MSRMGEGRRYLPVNRKNPKGIVLEAEIDGEKVYRLVVQTNIAINGRDKSDTHYRLAGSKLFDQGSDYRIINPDYVGEARERVYNEVEKRFFRRKGLTKLLFGSGVDIQIQEHQESQNHESYSP